MNDTYEVMSQIQESNTSDFEKTYKAGNIKTFQVKYPTGNSVLTKFKFSKWGVLDFTQSGEYTLGFTHHFHK